MSDDDKADVVSIDDLRGASLRDLTVYMPSPYSELPEVIESLNDAVEGFNEIARQIERGDVGSLSDEGSKVVVNLDAEEMANKMTEYRMAVARELLDAAEDIDE